MEIPARSPQSRFAPRASSATPRGGFALVIALSLMAFILLLLLSITTLVRVETQSAEISLSTLKARQNAMLGAMIAVGELQQHAGVDQILTSTSEYIHGVGTLVDAPADASNPGGNTVEQKHWTGIWEAQSPTGNPDLEFNRHLMWLVSGNEAVDPDAANFFRDDSNGLGQIKLYARPNMGNGSLAADHVWMVHDGSVGTIDETNYVQVPEVEFDDGEGTYAWWVGDEGVKAPLTLEDPHAGTDLSYRVAQKPDFTNVPELGTSFEDDAGRLKITGIEEMELAGASATASKDRFWDVTPFSLGVLADARHGGLRKDLTRAFAPDTDAALDLIRDDLVDIGRPAATSDYIFDPASGTETADDPGGPRWEQLRDFYNLRPNSGSASSGFTIDLTTGGTPAIPIDHRDDQLGVFPVMNWAQIRYYLTLTTDGVSDTATKRKLRFWFLPTIMLWNPYDIDLVIPDLWVQFSTSLGSADRDTFRYKWLAFSGGNPPLTNQQGFFASSASNDPLPLILKLEGTTIPAGESVLFKVASHQQVTPSSSMRNGVNGNVLSSAASASIDYGLYFDDSNNAAEFNYDPLNPADFQGVIRKPNNDLNDLDINVWLATDPTFSVSAIVQQVNSIENSIPLAAGTTGNSPTGTTQNVVINPIVESPTVVPFDSSTYDRYPAIANSFVSTWTNNWVAGASSTYQGFPWASLSNPRASFAGRSGFGRDEADTSSSGEIGHMPGYVSHGSQHGFLNPNVPGRAWLIYSDSNEKPYVGWDYKDELQQTFLYEIPKSDLDLLSIGQFMHANLSRNNNFDTNATGDKVNWYQVGNRHLYDNLTPAYPIGNSWADPHIPLSSSSVDWSTVANIGSATGTHYDYSYLLNNALWDRYFISGVPQSGGGLPNSRYIDNPFDLSITDAERQDFHQAASSYMIDGVFNVNSTSVDAWRALLSSFLGVTVTLEGGANSAGSGSAFTRFNRPIAGEYLGTQNDTTAYNGYRRLTTDEIDELATEIVNELKKDPQAPSDNDDGGRRDPYRGLADFVNRDLSGHQRAQLKGVLQRAIDNTSINDSIESGDVLEYANSNLDTTGSPGYTVEAIDEIPIDMGVPGYLTQADVLARIGPVLTARSDTFRVRAYGSSRDPISGNQNSEAWAEVLVQRIPEYVDNSVAPETALSDLVSDSLNERFGRRFRILSFRWLSEGEI